MSVQSITSKVQYILSSATQTLTVPFYFLENSHLKVIKAGETQTVLVLNTDYTVTGVGVEAGGSITLTGAGTDIADVITIKRSVPITQLVDYVYNDRFPAETHERALDKLTMICQFLQEQAERSLRFEDGEVLDGLMEFETRKGKFIYFNAEDGTLEFADGQDILDAADAAEAAKVAAEAAQLAAEQARDAAAGGAGIWQVKTGSFVAANDSWNRMTATGTVTDPAPVAGKGFIVHVRAGTATIGGSAYPAGTVVYRTYTSSWATSIFTAEGATGTSLAATITAAAAKAILGLDLVNNTSDLGKPLSTTQRACIVYPDWAAQDRNAINTRTATENKAITRFLETIAGFTTKIYRLGLFTVSDPRNPIINRLGTQFDTLNTALTNSAFIGAQSGIMFGEPSNPFYLDTGINMPDLAGPSNLSYGYFATTDRNSVSEVMGLLGSGSGAGRLLLNLGASGTWRVAMNIGDTGYATAAGSALTENYTGLWAATSTGTTGAVYKNGTSVASFTSSASLFGTDFLVGRGATTAPTAGACAMCGGYFIGTYLTATEVATLSTAWQRLHYDLGMVSLSHTAFAALCDRTLAIMNRIRYDTVNVARDWDGELMLPPGDGYYQTEFVRDTAMMFRYRPELFTPSYVARRADIFFGARDAGIAEVKDLAFYAGEGTSPIQGNSRDNIYELIDIIYTHYQMTGSVDLFVRYRSEIIAAEAAITKTNELVYIADNANFNLIPAGWGFQDGLPITGYELMTSVFRYRALGQLAEMARLSGYKSAAVAWEALLPTIRASLITYLWDGSGGSAGLFKSGSIKNSTTHSIPANAYAVVVGAVTGAERTAIIASLFDGLTTNTFVQNGSIRHLLSSESWTSVRNNPATGVPYAAGTFQNGGFWPCFTGWVAQAIRSSHPTEAEALLTALLTYHRGYSATSTCPEYVFPVTGPYPTGQPASPIYGATAAAPLGYFKNLSR